MLQGMVALMATSGSAYDADAAAFITATGITDTNEKNAIDGLVKAAKTNGWWTKCSAIYPMVGGTSTTCKYNLKDPRDLDAAFRLTFSGSPAISKAGVAWNGINQYADTHLVPNTTLSLNDVHISYYSASNTYTSNRVDMGCLTTGGDELDLAICNQFSSYAGGTNCTGFSLGTNGFGGLVYAILERSGVNTSTVYLNGSSQSSSGTASNARSTHSIYLGAVNNNGTAGYFGTKTCLFATIGLSIGGTIAALMYADIEAFQRVLNREIKLLDRCPDAKLAYSLRKLKSTYSGYAIKVRRSSDNTEQDIGFTVAGDLDESSLTTFVGANDGFITKWYDQSGNANDSAQTTNANQPKIVNSGTIYKMGLRPSVHFSGSQFLSIATPFSATAGYSNYIVNSRASISDLMFGISTDGTFPLINWWNTDGYIYSGYDTLSGYHWYGGAGSGEIGLKLHIAYTDGSTVLQWSNNTALTAFGSTPQVGWNINSIGKSTYGNAVGDMFEAIHYERNVTDSSSQNGQVLVTNMNAYYNIF